MVVIHNQDGVILIHDVVISTNALLFQPKFELHLCAHTLITSVAIYTDELESVLNL